MTHWFKRLSLTLALFGLAATALAEDAKYQAAEDKLTQQLGLEVTSIKASPVPGLLEAFTDRGLFYISEDGNFFIQGRVFNINERMKNETEASLASVRLDGLKQFEDSMIEFKAKDEKFAISVFTDITCGYCRKLHDQIEEYNDLGITVRYLGFPRAGIDSQPHKDMISVWCADDQQSAITEAKNGKSVRSKECNQEQIAAQYRFGQQIGVSGTPAIVLENGQMIPGYQPPQQLLQALQQTL